MPGKSHGQRSLVGCSPWGRGVRHDWATSLSRIGEGNGSPLQYSCLENPRDGGAWWAAIYGVAQSLTQLTDWARAHTHKHTYGKMYESGSLRLPLSHASQPSGTSILFSHPELPFLRAYCRKWVSLMTARWQIFSFLSSLRAHWLMLEGCNHWWLWHPCLLIWQEIFYFSPRHTTKQWKSRNPYCYSQQPGRLSLL